MKRTLPDPDLGFPDTTGRPLRFSTLRDGDSIAIVLSGELDLAFADELDAEIRDLEETDIGRIVVDLSEVTFVDSTGLNVLLAAKKRSNGRFIVRPSNHEAVTSLLELTGTTEFLGC